MNPVGICYREGFLATRRYRQVHVRKWTRTRQSRELLQQKLFTPLKMTAANGDGRHDTTYVKPSTHSVSSSRSRHVCKRLVSMMGSRLI